MTPGRDAALPLVRYFFGAYALLVVYASLHPLSGWTNPGLSPFAFVTAPFPRVISRFDTIINVIGYLPLGFLAVLAVHPRLKGAAAAAFAIACSVLLSFTLESLQYYLPSRASSNVDLIANTVGGVLGACLALSALPRLLREDGFHALRHRLFLPGAKIDFGLVLLALWLMSQLSPETLLFGAGDLRELFPSPSGKLHPAELFVRVEAAVACANTVALGLLLSCLAGRDGTARLMFCGLLIAALAARSVAFGVLLKDPLLWITPGALFGLAAGGIGALVCISLRRSLRPALAGLALMCATVIVNLAPENPYLAASLALWQRGPYFNFNGVTHIVSAAWPFAALFYLLFFAADRDRARS